MPAARVSTSADPAEFGPSLLRPLRIRDFRLLFAGETVSVLGDQFHFVALAWLALQLSGSGLALGTVLMTAAIDAGAVMLVFVAAGAMVIVAALAGFAWGVPTKMVWPDEA